MRLWLHWPLHLVLRPSHAGAPVRRWPTLGLLRHRAEFVCWVKRSLCVGLGLLEVAWFGVAWFGVGWVWVGLGWFGFGVGLIGLGLVGLG